MFVVKNKWINTCKCLEQRAWSVVTLCGVVIHIILQNSEPQAPFFTIDLQRETDFRKDANYQFLWSSALELMNQSS